MSQNKSNNNRITFTQSQLSSIRSALNAYAKYGNDGKGFSNPQLAGELSALGGGDILSEAVRRFRWGDYDDPQTGEIKPPEKIDVIAKALADPQIGLIEPDSIFSEDEQTSLPLYFSKFLSVQNEKINEEIYGSYSTSIKHNEQTVFVSLFLKGVNQENLIRANIVQDISKNTDGKSPPNIISKREFSGWGFLSNEDILFLMMSDAKDGSSHFFVTLHGAYTFISDDGVSSLALSSLDQGSIDPGIVTQISQSSNADPKITALVSSIMGDFLSKNTQVIERVSAVNLQYRENHYKIILEENKKKFDQGDFDEDNKPSFGQSSPMFRSDDDGFDGLSLNILDEVSNIMNNEKIETGISPNLRAKFSRKMDIPLLDAASHPGYEQFVKNEELISIVRNHSAPRDYVDIEEKIKAIADINYQNEYGMTLLHYAAAYEDKRLVSLLVDMEGIDPDIRDKQGRTAEDIALGSVNFGLMDLLSRPTI